MDVEQWRRIDELLELAMDLPEEERTTFVEGAAAGNPTLHRNVLELLTADAHAEGFLQSPVAGSLPGVLAPLVSPLETSIGPYRLVDVLGHGGMGSVYLAERREGFQRRVAIKLLRSDLATRELEIRLRLERQVLAELEHPHVARLYDGGTTEDGRPYLVMEYVEGVPIDRYCRKHSLSVEERVELFLQVCDAVEHAHRNLLIHRDLKPANILVTARGEPKLLDFGIAKLLDSARFGIKTLVTRQGLRPMTPEFASPEQVRGGAVTTASDVYGLGVLLFHLLTGESPYRPRPDLPHAVEAAVLEQAPARASDVVNDPALARRLRGDLDTILQKALRKEPERRYGSVREMAEDLTRHLEHRPVLARPEKLAYRLGKLVRRHTFAVVTGVLFVVLVVGFGIFTALQSSRLARERDLARSAGQRAERTSELLLDLLASPAPEQAQGKELTVRDVLDRGAERVRRMDDQPDLQADSRAVIGEVYRELGFLDAAEPLLRAALGQRRRLHGELHPDVAESVGSLAQLDYVRGDYEAAETGFRQALDMRQELFGPGHILIAEALEDLGLALHAQRRFEEAETVFRQALAIAQEQSGPRSRLVADLLNDLGLTLHDKVRLDQAEAAYRDSLELTRELLGPRHPAVASTLNNLAVLLHDRGDLDGAAKLHEDSLALRRELYGESHPQIALAAYNVARLHHRLGRQEEAEALYRESLAISRKVLGTHLYAAKALEWLGRLLGEQGRWEEAQGMMAESLAMYGELGASRSQTAANLLDAMGNLAEARGRFSEAAELYRRSMEQDRELLGAEDPWAAVSEVHLARVRIRLGEGGDAEARAVEALPGFRQRLEEAPGQAQERFWRSQILVTEGVIWASRLTRGQEVSTARDRLEDITEELEALDWGSFHQPARALRQILDEGQE